MDVSGAEHDVRPQRVVDPFQGAVRVCAMGTLAVCAIVGTVAESSQFTAESLAIVLVSFLLGVLIPLFFFHPFRVLGLCPPAVLVIACAVAASWALGAWPSWTLALMSFGAGIVLGVAGRCERTFAARTPAVRVVTRMVDRATIPLLPAFLAAAWWGTGSPWPLLAGLTGLLLAHTWTRLFRPFFELCVEAVIWKGYRIAAAGTGMAELPTHGPLLVIANHACWWDPLFLAKALPRPVTPMMTSLFYDRWFLKPLMVHVFQTIRVADAHLRREAPEIAEAIRALDAGKCVVIFPEGYLRRKEEVPLRRFGRGVWEILKARPQTPVVACWIEGNWGSYTSYWNGPPTKNKSAEGHRAIAVGLSPPVVVPAGTLDHHLRTRIAMMNEVIRARRHHGLPDLPPFETIAADEVEKSA